MRMKNIKRIISFLLSVCLIAACFSGCDKKDNAPSSQTIDYVAETKLDLDSDTNKLEVTVKNYIDGDTTHFNVPTEIKNTGVLKARYIGINTPESTGKIEEWGKKASRFTKEKLLSAVSIYIESEDDKWNVDSTGDRHLVWVWYKTAESEDYRCLNLELVQNGLTFSCGTVEDRYGEVMSKAHQQAKKQKLNVHSDEEDPEFYYGDAYEIDLKHLRTNIDLYNGAKVAFEGVITYNNDNSVYVEEYDAETDMHYGMSVYYGFSLSGEGIRIMQPGNRIRVVGKVSYWETGDSWQVSDVNYSEFDLEDPDNLVKISEGHEPAYYEVDAGVFTNGQMDIEVLSSLDSEEVELKTFDYSKLAICTSISMKNLEVIDVYTTQNGGDSDGAMTLTCKVGEDYVDVRTVVLRDENGNLITESEYLNKTIDVKGIIDCFDKEYQIKVFKAEDIIIH